MKMIAFLSAFWNVLAEMAPWLMGGFFLAGLMGVLLSREWIVKVMGQSRGLRGILNACLLGIPLPVCSCGTIALSAGLRKAGAGKGATAAFLISTPQTGIDSIIATYALLGPVFAAARPLAALLTGLMGGIAVDWVAEKDEAPVPEKKTCCCHNHGHPHETASANPASEAVKRPNFIVRVLKAAYVDLPGRIAKPLLMGLVISALVTVLLPENFFVSVLGGRSYLQIPLMVLLGFPMYVCSTASIPIAASFIWKGISPGAAFVFLMVGPAINAASMAAVTPLIGKKAAWVYGGVIALGAVLCGVLMNLLPAGSIVPDAVHCAGENDPGVAGHLSAVALLALSVYHTLRSKMRKDGTGKC